MADHFLMTTKCYTTAARSAPLLATPATVSTLDLSMHCFQVESFDYQKRYDACGLLELQKRDTTNIRNWEVLKR